MRSLQVLLVDWRGARTDMERLVRNMPRVIGVEAVRVVKQNFNLHGYDSGNGFEKWEDRKDATNRAYAANRKKGRQGIYKGSVYSPIKPLLKQTLNLYNNIKYQTRGMSSVIIGVDRGLVPYAEAHNEGLHHEPMRQFMPHPDQAPNKKILNQIEKKYIHERDRAMKRFLK